MKPTTRNLLLRTARIPHLAPIGMCAAGALLLTCALSAAQDTSSERPAAATRCTGDNGGITLPTGFCATVFADNIGHVRQMAVAPNGVLYVNTWSGLYYRNDKPPAGGFLIALRDTTGSGHADQVVRFGPGADTGNAGGTGIALYNGALYAETNDRIVRYALPKDGMVPGGTPDVIVSGLPLTGDHPMHPFRINAKGELFVDLGSATNSCQVANRMPNSPGIRPCTELETRAGTWRYDANRTGQRFSPAERFVTGLRNGEGIAFDSTGRIIATQHGRDQLRENWPALYTPQAGANEPAEELVQLERGADYGWPYCYFDLTQNKLVLAPEYGGDGGKTVGLCAQKRAPIAAFPGHWAPNDMILYEGQLFPDAYRGGAFIAFHGSWNRAPFPQGGYNVVFQPLKDGKASGPFVVFADGFAGAVKEPGQAAHRPTGLAVGTDGALYVSDDAHSRIWKITYSGPATAAVAAAATPSSRADNSARDASTPPEGIHPNAGAETTGVLSVPTPPGATREQVALGHRIFEGEVASAPCAGCHGTDGKGSPLGPDLTSGKWLWGNGSLAAIAHTIDTGVAKPKSYGSPMPPKGGAELSPAQVTAVAAYVWSLGHPNGH
jgi:glucose/arabinose dehydrogenase/mono/diheme cytochrome c family protein